MFYHHNNVSITFTIWLLWCGFEGLNIDWIVSDCLTPAPTVLQKTVAEYCFTKVVSHSLVFLCVFFNTSSYWWVVRTCFNVSHSLNKYLVSCWFKCQMWAVLNSCWSLLKQQTACAAENHVNTSELKNKSKVSVFWSSYKQLWSFLYMQLNNLAFNMITSVLQH